MISEVKLKCQRLLPIKMHILEGKGEGKHIYHKILIITIRYNFLGHLKIFFAALALPSTY